MYTGKTTFVRQDTIKKPVILKKLIRKDILEEEAAGRKSRVFRFLIRENNA